MSTVKSPACVVCLCICVGPCVCVSECMYICMYVCVLVCLCVCVCCVCVCECRCARVFPQDLFDLSRGSDRAVRQRMDELRWCQSANGSHSPVILSAAETAPAAAAISENQLLLIILRASRATIFDSAFRLRREKMVTWTDVRRADVRNVSLATGDQVTSVTPQSPL